MYNMGLGGTLDTMENVLGTYVWIYKKCNREPCKQPILAESSHYSPYVQSIHKAGPLPSWHLLSQIHIGIDGVKLALTLNTLCYTIQLPTLRYPMLRMTKIDFLGIWQFAPQRVPQPLIFTEKSTENSIGLKLASAECFKHIAPYQVFYT